MEASSGIVDSRLISWDRDVPLLRGWGGGGVNFYIGTYRGYIKSYRQEPFVGKVDTYFTFLGSQVL